MPDSSHKDQRPITNQSLPNNQRFPKNQRLRSQRLTDQLFGGQGRSLTVYPLRAVFAPCESSTQILISVPKRRLHRAVDRNRLRRQVREAWRLQRQPLIDLLAERGQQLAIAFIALADQPVPTSRVFFSMRKLLRRIGETLTSTQSHV